MLATENATEVNYADMSVEDFAKFLFGNSQPRAKTVSQPKVKLRDAPKKPQYRRHKIDLPVRREKPQAYTDEQLLELLYKAGIWSGGFVPNLNTVKRYMATKEYIGIKPASSTLAIRLGSSTVDWPPKLNAFCDRHGYEHLELPAKRKEAEQAAKVAEKRDQYTKIVYELSMKLGRVAGSSDIKRYRDNCVMEMVLRYVGRVTTWPEVIKAYAEQNKLPEPPKTVLSREDLWRSTMQAK